MSVKSWVHGGVQRINGLVSRSDLPPRESAFDTPSAGHAAGASGAVPRSASSEAVLAPSTPLGAYAGLVAALRDELEHFVASQVRLHLAIADHDRFLLSALSVRCPDGGAARQRLAEFMREFKPEQIKRYLARDVIGALPNAAAIDLSHFAGLLDADASPATLEEATGGEYRELLEALRGPQAKGAARPYEVAIVGRWVENDPARAPALAAQGLQNAVPSKSRVQAPTPATPLAGQRCQFELEDADGRRRIGLQAVPGRRYIVGKGEGCDIRVNGTFASRRHAELWLQDGRWWAADAGSTNGLRVEAADGRAAGALEAEGGARSGRSRASGVAEAAQADADAPLPLREGARLVLSARADGPPHEYPWIALASAVSDVNAGSARITPIAQPASAQAAMPAMSPTAATTPALSASPAAASRLTATPSTPLTAIMVARPSVLFNVTAELASGERSIGLHPGLLPASIGRSRNQSLVIDREHQGVSGHHLDIVELDEDGATVVVHGDNGVLVDGVRHAPGSRLRWRVGVSLMLGQALRDVPSCRLALARVDADDAAQLLLLDD